VRILIVTLNYLPELTGIGKYNGEMAEWLVAKGHEVQIVTAPPYYPQWSVSEEYSTWKYSKEIVGNVNVWRCPLWVPNSPSGVKRILHLVSFMLSSFPVMLSQVIRRPDIVLVIEPPLFCAPTSLFISLLIRSRSWLHVQDFEVDAAFDLNILSSPRLKHFVLKVERWFMSKFDRVSTISTQMIRRLDTKNVSREKQILFPNWVDIDHIYPLNTPNTYREQYCFAVSNIIFLYSGNMGEKQGLEIIIEAAQKLADYKNIKFVMCGQGAAYHRLKILADGLDNIHWLPLQPLNALNDLLNMADIHLLPQRADAADLVMPSKLTGMLASGRPVLATAYPDTQIAEVLESAGIIVPPENLDLFADAILHLASNSGLRQNLGNNAREYAVKHLGKEAILSRFEESLLSCVEAQK